MGNEEPTQGKGGGDGSGEKALGRIAVWVAIGLIGLYAFGIVWMWLVGQDDPVRTSLLDRVEPLVGAAVGALFGTAVERRVTKKAETQAKEAKERADEHEGKARKLDEVRGFAQAHRGGGGGGGAVRGGGGGGGFSGDELLRLIDSRSAAYGGTEAE